MNCLYQFFVQKTILLSTVVVASFIVHTGNGAPLEGTEVQEATKEKQSSVAAQLRTIRQKSADPSVQVANIAAWLSAHPELKTLPQKSNPPTPPVPIRTLTGPAAIRQQISDGVRDARALSSNPEEQVKLVNEFLSLNAATLASLKPQVTADSPALNQARFAQIQSRLAAKPDDLNAQMVEAMFDIRKQPDPQEQVRLIAELFNLNRDLLKQAKLQRVSTLSAENK